MRQPKQNRFDRAGPRLALLVALTGCTTVAGGGDEFGGGPAPRAVTPEEAAERGIRERDIRRTLGFLADDELRGRETPGPELDRAAAWIASRFREAGLEPAGEDGGYIHFWRSDAGEDAAPPSADDTAAARAPNVVGVLSGADVARSGDYVIVASHFADDDASGIAALLAVARAFQALGDPPARPVLFLATSGDEAGLPGARAFVRQPTLFLAEAVAVLNVETARADGSDTVLVDGEGLSTLGPLIEEMAGATGVDLVVRVDAGSRDDRFRRGDATPFGALGIPTVAVTGPARDEAETGDADTAAADRVARIARLVFLVAHELAAAAGGAAGLP